MAEPDPDAAPALASELRAVVGKLKRKLREHANAGELGASEATVLVRLERHGPATMSALARAEGMRPQSMRSLITPLEAEGFVQSAPDPNDGRQVIFSITQAGGAVIAQRRAQRQDWLTGRITTLLSPAEQAVLGQAVSLLKRLVDD